MIMWQLNHLTLNSISLFPKILYFRAKFLPAYSYNSGEKPNSVPCGGTEEAELFRKRGSTNYTNDEKKHGYFFYCLTSCIRKISNYQKHIDLKAV